MNRVRVRYLIRLDSGRSFSIETPGQGESVDDAVDDAERFMHCCIDALGVWSWEIERLTVLPDKAVEVGTAEAVG